MKLTARVIVIYTLLFLLSIQNLLLILAILFAPAIGALKNMRAGGPPVGRPEPKLGGGRG